MNENKSTTLTAEQDYRENFMPRVHVVGRGTMALAFILSFLPVIYFLVVKGYTLPAQIYISGTVGVVSIGFGMWISEPEAYWPILGSAGTYISYLSGNVGGMRFPVASTVQKNMNADITTPRGQVVTVVGIVASVVANLIILLVIVLAGDWLLSVLPAVALAAFGYCMVSMMGSMLIMNFSMRGGLKGLPVNLMYIAWGAAAWFVCTKLVAALATWGMAIGVGGAVLISYLKYRMDVAKAK